MSRADGAGCAATAIALNDYLGAALDAGLTVRRFAEDSSTAAEREPQPLPMPDHIEVVPWEARPWVLTDLVPEAGRVVAADVHSVIMWHFSL